MSFFKGKILIDILSKIGFKKKEGGLRVLFIMNRKGISKIGFCVAKKKIRGSVERNIIKRRIRIAYKISMKKIEYLSVKLLIFLFWEETKIPSLMEVEILIKKIFHNFLTQTPKLIYYKP